MVRNSKRKAFTIVELVIVIAVIAILAAVMIPTFGGVIESANVSADKQMLSGMNSQISIYIGTGNKIETEADLWEALKGEKTTGGTDFTTKLNPKSAKHGYHYFYESASQTVKLLEYTEATEGTALRATGKMLVRAGGLEVRAAGEDFALASPRSFMPGYYFLDKVADGEGNDFSKLFDKIENLSAAANSEAYDAAKTVITNLSNRDDNKDFANKLVERLDVTAILTDKDPIKGDTVKHVYIPENVDSKDNYTIKAIGDVSVDTNFNANIQIPENVNLGDSCFDALNDALDVLNKANENNADYQEIKIKLDITITFADDDELETKIEAVFSAQSVKGDLTINGSMNATSDGIFVKIDGKDDIKLNFKNPVTEDFTISANGDYIDGQYIALHKINEGDFKLNIGKTAALTGKNGEATYVPTCQDLTWEFGTLDALGNFTKLEAVEGVTITADGLLSFDQNFNGSTITLRATPVAVNDVDVAPKAIITLTVVKLNKVNFAFDGAAMDLTAPTKTLLVDYGDSADFSNFTYSYVTNDAAATTISGLNTAKLGVPSLAVITAADNTHFGITSDNGTYNLGFNMDQVRTTILSGDGYVSENVTINVGKDGSLFTNTYEVRIEPCLFASALPSYKGYVYTIGDENAIALGKLFKLTDLFEGATVTADVTVKTYQAESVTPEGIPVKPVDTTSNNTINKEGKTSWTDYEITFTDLNTNVIAISTNTEMKYISVKVVEGFNIFAGEEAKFVNSTSADSDKSITVTNGNQSVVLHGNLDFTGKYTEDCVRTLQGAKIWGNYYKLTAKDFKDTDTNTNNGYGFIHVSSGDNEINQLIIDGPVYAEPATSASDLLSLGITNKYKNFCNGINVGSNLTINDSYIFGFNSTVRVNGGDFVANGTVFDGGAWSNIFLANATKFQLNDCKTIQDAYQATVDDTTQYSIGLGIYVHDTMNNKNQAKLTLELNNTKQYNWISTDDKQYGGTFFDLAVDEIFKDGGLAETQQFIHQEKYVNAAVASIGARLEVWMLITTKKATVTEYTDNYSLGGTDGSKYTAQKVDEETKVNILVANVFVKANVYSYQCGDSCDCGTENAGIGFTYNIDKFLAERK